MSGPEAMWRTGACVQAAQDQLPLELHWYYIALGPTFLQGSSVPTHDSSFLCD